MTRFTLLYFTFALVACFTLVVLEGVTLAGDREGTKVLSQVLSHANASRANSGLPLFLDGRLLACDGIPGQAGGDCRVLRQVDPRGHYSVCCTSPSKARKINIIQVNGTSAVNARRVSDEGDAFVDNLSTRVTVTPLVLSDDCIASLQWLLET